MGEKIKSFEDLVKEAKEHNQLTNKKALEILVYRLKNNPSSYYKWAALGDGDLSSWQVRTPRNNLPDEVWLKEQSVELIHICKPIKYLECVLTKNNSDAAKYGNYVRDKDNGKKNEKDFSCKACKKKMPLELAKMGKMHIAFHKLGTKR